MKIIEVSASCSRTIPHEFVKFNMAKPMVSIKAEVAEGDDELECIRELQKKAEKMVDEHCSRLREYWKGGGK